MSDGSDLFARIQDLVGSQLPEELVDLHELKESRDALNENIRIMALEAEELQMQGPSAGEKLDTLLDDMDEAVTMVDRATERLQGASDALWDLYESFEAVAILSASDSFNESVSPHVCPGTVACGTADSSSRVGSAVADLLTELPAADSNVQRPPPHPSTAPAGAHRAVHYAAVPDKRVLSAASPFRPPHGSSAARCGGSATADAVQILKAALATYRTRHSAIAPVTSGRRRLGAR